MMNQKQILCVEDEAAIILPLRYALEREGWNVSWANTGAQALQYLSEQAFDFIILESAVGFNSRNNFTLAYCCFGISIENGFALYLFMEKTG